MAAGLMCCTCCIPQLPPQTSVCALARSSRWQHVAAAAATISSHSIHTTAAAPAPPARQSRRGGPVGSRTRPGWRSGACRSSSASPPGTAWRLAGEVQWRREGANEEGWHAWEGGGDGIWHGGIAWQAQQKMRECPQHSTRQHPAVPSSLASTLPSPAPTGRELAQMAGQAHNGGGVDGGGFAAVVPRVRVNGQLHEAAQRVAHLKEKRQGSREGGCNGWTDTTERGWVQRSTNLEQ